MGGGERGLGALPCSLQESVSVGPRADVCEAPTSPILHRWTNRKLSVTLRSPPGDCLSCPDDSGLVLMSQ